MNHYWTVIVLHSVEKKISILPKADRERIQTAINSLADGPNAEGLDVKPLKVRPEWRLRIGNWRILFRVDYERIIIKVIKLAARGDVYKK